MGLLNKLFGSKKSETKPPKISGYIGYYGLENWWLTELTEEQRNYLLNTAFGENSFKLTQKTFDTTSQSVLTFFSTMIDWIKKGDPIIIDRIFDKAESLITEQSNIIDVHFLYSVKVDYYHNLIPEKAIEACNQQISIATPAANAFKKEYKKSPLPSHNGFKTLSIILEKKKEYKQVINLCKKVHKMKWAGDWEKRIARCTKKLV